MFKFEENDRLLVKKLAVLEKALSTDPKIEKKIKNLIDREIQKARKNVVQSVGSQIKNDPRDAKNSIRRTIYKRILGANLNILDRIGDGTVTDYVPPRKLDSNPRQRGGNRVPRSDRTKQLQSYGSDMRGFILRFLNSGTGIREAGTKGGGLHGNRGEIAPRNFFKEDAQIEMEKAVERLTEVLEYELAMVMDDF